MSDQVRSIVAHARCGRVMPVVLMPMSSAQTATSIRGGHPTVHTVLVELMIVIPVHV